MTRQKKIKCHYCKQEIIGDYIEVPKLDRNGNEKKDNNGIVLLNFAHDKCYDENQKIIEERYLLFEYVKNTYFMIGFPQYMAICLMNLNKHGSRFGKANDNGYPFIVLYRAFKTAEKDCKNYIEYAEKNNLIHNSEHKSNIILKSIEKHLEKCFKEWLTVRNRLDIEEINRAEIYISTETQEKNIQLPNKFKKLIDFGE